MLKLGPVKKQINEMLQEKIKNKNEFLEKLRIGFSELINGKKIPNY